MPSTTANPIHSASTERMRAVWRRSTRSFRWPQRTGTDSRRSGQSGDPVTLLLAYWNATLPEPACAGPAVI